MANLYEDDAMELDLVRVVHGQHRMHSESLAVHLSHESKSEQIRIFLLRFTLFSE